MAQIAGVHKEKLLISATTGTFFAVNPGLQQVLDQSSVPLSVTIHCDGGSVEIGLMPDGTSGGSQLNSDGRSATNSATSQVLFYRDGTPISTLAWGMTDIASSPRQISLPGQSFSFTDVPPAGIHTYTVYINNGNPTLNNNDISNTVLYAIQR